MDMFSQPFAFRIGKKDEAKSTSIGFLTTLIVVGASLLYLVYLGLAYANDSFAPTIVEENESVDSVTQTLDYSPIMFKFNVPPSITSELLPRYFRYYAQKAQGTTDGDNITIVNCSTITKNADYPDYYCIDPSQADDLEIDSDGGYNQIYIRVWKCAYPPESNLCETSDTIKEVMEDRMFSIEALIAYYEFNHELGELELKYKKRNIPGDDSIVSWQIIELKQTTLMIDRGFFVEDWQTHEYISDYSQDLIPLQQEFMKTKYSLSAQIFMQFEVRMELSNVLITVQYVKLSTLLAMFSAIFGVLLNLGIIAKLASKSMIYKELLDNYIKEYYRESAFQIARKKEVKLNGGTKHDEKDILSQQEINKIKNKMLRENLVQSNGEFQSIFTYLKSKKAPETVSNSTQASKVSSETQLKESIEQEDLYDLANRKLPDLMNANALYNEIYSLKTAVQLLLKPEQYAMMVNIGRRLLRTDGIQHLDQLTLNHLEKMSVIEDNSDVREKLCQRYMIEKTQTNSEMSEVDKRIMESLLSHIKEQNNLKAESPVVQSLNESFHGKSTNQVK